jgi:hypothetical protein
MDSIIQVHRRKMQRRQANRKSAQLSRARKKAHLEELKEENFRLQRIVNILDSLPEFVFSFTSKGTITYIPDNLAAMIKSAADDPDEEITHVSQLLTAESVSTLFDSVSELTCAQSKGQMVTFVREVFYQDATGFPVAGYMRCTRLVHRIVPVKEEDDGQGNSSDSETEMSLQTARHPHKRKKPESSDSSVDKSSGGARDDSSRSMKKEDLPGPGLDEFVCVIRPASASSPQGLNNLHLLSAASMVAHDSHQRRSSDSEKVEKNRGSGSPSDGSRSSHNSSAQLGSSVTTHTTQQTKNSSASDTGSDDNQSSEPST